MIVATPDHWHSPAAILACEAGKHVYVEKPISHNIREGRLLVEAAQRNKVHVQHGIQSRSTETMIEAVKLLREGIIGDVLVAKCWNIQRRNALPPGQDTDPPTSLDYNNWIGPATMIPYRTNRVHKRWTMWYHFGAGEMGNDGVHDVEYARWGLGVETHPTKVAALGGKYYFHDEQEFPDTQQVTFEYPGDGKPGSKRMLIYEQRLFSTNYPYNCDSGAEFYGTKGQMFLSRRGKLQVLADRNQKVNVDVKLVEQDDRRTHPEPLRRHSRGREAQRRCDDGPPDDDALPPGQHRHALGAFAHVRPANRTDRRRRRGQRPGSPRVPGPLGDPAGGMNRLGEQADYRDNAACGLATAKPQAEIEHVETNPCCPFTRPV